jgi:hypothetical protein
MSELHQYIPALGGIAAVVTVALAWTRGRHPLSTADQLGGMLDKIQHKEGKKLVQNHHDATVARWVLEQEAPKYSGYGRFGWLAFGIAISFFAVWLVGVIIDTANPVYWIYYIAWVILTLVAGLLFDKRDRRRTEWVEETARAKGIVLVKPAVPGGVG